MAKSKFKTWLHKHDGGERTIVQTEKNVQFDNALFFPLIIEEIKKGHTVTINLRGRSMRPFLESDRDKALLTKPENLKEGDPVLAEVEPGHFVLHRIWKIDGENVTLMGDGNLTYEHCTTKDFRASIIGFYRKGRTTLDRVDGSKWKIYSWWWIHLTPIRRYLLAAYRYIWLNIFKLK